MNEPDLIREARTALDDLVDLAPKAPSLKAIIAGYAPLRRVEPPVTRWRTAVILAGAAAVTLLVVGIATLIGSNVSDGDGVSGPGVSTSPSEESIDGIWVLTTYTYEGATQEVDEVALADQGRMPAWIEISSDEFTGSTGCNRIERAGTPTLNGQVLVFGEIVVQAAGCMGETPEPAMLEALWSGPDGVTVTLTDATMTWTTDTVALTFERRDRRPFAQPGEWPSSFGRLDCSPGVYLIQMLPGTGQSLADSLMEVPGVVTVEEGNLDGWGLDGEGTVIAGAVYGDVEPTVIHRGACADSFGVSTGTDLSAVTLIWVNNLGLAQTSQQVWSNRFVEICSADDPDLGALAGRYLDEDAATSVRGDGSAPSLEEAAMTLETIQRSACAAGRPGATTTVPPETQDGLSTTTTSITPSGPFVCSTTGMDIPADYAPSYEGLPDPVARTWAMLFDAALGCDFEFIISIARDGGLSESVDAIFWGATGTLEGLKRYDADNGSLRSLALALTTVPTAPFEGQRYDVETETAAPQVYWSWPPVHDDLGDGVGIEDLWDADTLSRVAALNDMTVAELIASVDEFGGYAGFRVGIAEDGRWLFALAGD